MARKSIPTIKSFFERGDKPTQQDYADMIDTTAAQATDLGTSGNNESIVSGIENQTVIDSFSATEWRMVKYLVSLSTVNNQYKSLYATELTVLIDGNDISVSEYGTIDNDGNMGTVTVSRNGNTIELIVNPESSINPITVRYARMGLKL